MEDSIIQRLRRLSPAAPLGPGDDCALLEDGTLLTADAMVEGVHWDQKLSAEDVGFKLAMVNASDIAAMGGRPTWALLTLCLPSPPDLSWVADFARGLEQALPCPLLGGDTTRSPGPRMVSLTMGGRLAGPPILRSGARPGDGVWVSGCLGEAAGGFAHPESSLIEALRRPRPPLELGPRLAGRVSGGMDLSDGLATDLRRLCAASGVGARIDPAALPISPALRALEADPLPLAVGWGEDYQLLVCSGEDLRDEGLTRVGEITEDRAVLLVGRPWPSTWQHF